MAEPAERSAGEPGARLHLAHVDGLRALAALMVYVNHAYAQIWYPPRGEYPKGSLGLLSYSLVTGHLAVAVFIAISGFCLALPVIAAGSRLRDGTLSFLKRRARRILPPFYGAVALCLILIATLIGETTGSPWDSPTQVDLLAILSHVLLLQDLVRTGSINYVFWSIAVEWHIYLVFPIIVLAWRRLGPLVTVLGALTIGFGVLLVASGTRVTRAQPHFLGIFCLGVLAAYIARSSDVRYARLRAAVPWRWLAAAFFAIACIVIAWLGIWGSIRAWPKLDFLVGGMAACLLVETSRNAPTILTRFLSAKPLVAIGTFSYSLYLIHAPFLQLMWLKLLRPLDLGAESMFAFLMTVGLAVVLGLSYVFFRFLEEPFMRKPQESRVRSGAAVIPVEPAQ